MKYDGTTGGVRIYRIIYLNNLIYYDIEIKPLFSFKIKIFTLDGRLIRELKKILNEIRPKGRKSDKRALYLSH